MKLVSFGPAGEERPGAVTDDRLILDLNRASGGEIRTIRGLLDRGEAGLERVARWLDRPEEEWLEPAAGVRLGPPVTNPVTIVGVGLNYHSHTSEQKARLPERPLLFSKAPTSLAGDGDPLSYPVDEENFDYEAELAFVIGKPALRIDPERWQEYVVGYTIVNDVSARDAQYADRKWFRGKSYDTTCPMGPYLVTRDEIVDPHDLRITAHLNGELRQDGTTSDLIFRVPDLLAFASRNITFMPGDVFATGTPGGVGIFMQPPACMQIGDEIRVTLEKVGSLTNRICECVAPGPSVYPSPRGG